MLTMEPFWLGSQTKIQEIKVFINRLDVNLLWKYEIVGQFDMQLDWNVEFIRIILCWYFSQSLDKRDISSKKVRIIEKKDNIWGHFCYSKLQ